MVTDMIVVGVVLTLVASGLVWLAKRTASLTLIGIAIVTSTFSAVCGLVFGFMAVDYSQNHTQSTPVVVILSVTILAMCLPIVMLFGGSLRPDRTLTTEERDEVMGWTDTE